MVSRRGGRLAAIVVVAAIVLAAIVARELRAGDDAPGRIGLNTHLQAAGDPLRPQLAEMRAGGVRWIREDFLWSRIEPQPGRFDWSASDLCCSLTPPLRLRPASSWASIPTSTCMSPS